MKPHFLTAVITVLVISVLCVLPLCLSINQRDATIAAQATSIRDGIATSNSLWLQCEDATNRLNLEIIRHEWTAQQLLVARSCGTNLDVVKIKQAIEIGACVSAQYFFIKLTHRDFDLDTDELLAIAYTKYLAKTGAILITNLNPLDEFMITNSTEPRLVSPSYSPSTPIQPGHYQ